MRFRGSGGSTEKIELQMTPMIDVVFQLLSFFMFTLKIMVPEGDFYVNMPLAAAAPGDPTESFQPSIRVRLESFPEDDPQAGQLSGVYLNDGRLPGESVEQVMRALNDRIHELARVMATPGAPVMAPDLEVEIAADYNLKHRYQMAAVTACSGRLEKQPSGTYELIKFIEKIKFAPPRRPAPP